MFRPNPGPGWTVGLILSTILLLQPAFSEPYRPYPIIFIHGINSNATTWGFEVDSAEIARGVDLTIPRRFRFAEHTAATFWTLMRPYEMPLSDEDTLWYIAALNFDDFGGSIDPGPYDSPNQAESTYVQNGDTITIQIPLENKGSGAELRYFIYKVLRTYYGANWRNTPDAKVVLVAHSMGGAVVAEALRQDPTLKQHVWKVIVLGSPVKDQYITHPRYKPIFVTALHWNPFFLLIRPLTSALVNFVAAQTCMPPQGLERTIEQFLITHDPFNIAVALIGGVRIASIDTVYNLICSGNPVKVVQGWKWGWKQSISRLIAGWMDFPAHGGIYMDFLMDMLYLFHLLAIYTPWGERLTLKILDGVLHIGIQYDQPATRDLWHGSGFFVELSLS